jgi:hypothetical protein
VELVSAVKILTSNHINLTGMVVATNGATGWQTVRCAVTSAIHYDRDDLTILA